MGITLIVIFSLSLGFVLGTIFTSIVKKNKYHVDITAEDTDFENEVPANEQVTNFLTNIELEDLAQFIDTNLQYQRKKVDFIDMKNNILSKLRILK